MHRILLTGFLTLAPLALAQGPNPERFEQHRAERVTAISQALGLDDAGTQRIKAAFDDFAGREQALHEQMRAQGKVLHQAAQGDAAAQAQVDSAIAQLRALRQQGEKLHEELFASLSQGLNAQQKAQLVLALRPGEGHRHGRGSEKGR